MSKTTSTTPESKNLTAVLHGVEDLRLDSFPVPEISAYEVLIEVDCVGITELDIHYYLNFEFDLDQELVQPIVLGNEGAGVVVKIGRLVTCLKVGDRVAIEATYGCKMCHFCKWGRYNLCQNAVICGTPPHRGMLGYFFSHPADSCHILPPKVSMSEGALIEPLAMAIHACRVAGIIPGSDVLIFGCSFLGLAILLVAQSMGATNILVADHVKHRIDLAMTLGAKHTIKLDLEINEKTLIKKIKALMRTQPNKTIDAYNDEAVARVGAASTRAGGCVVAVGLKPTETKFPLQHVCFKEVDIIGSFRHCNNYKSAIAMIESGKINIKPMITHHFELSELQKGVDTARYKHGMKVIIHCKSRDKNDLSDRASQPWTCN